MSNFEEKNGPLSWYRVHGGMTYMAWHQIYKMHHSGDFSLIVPEKLAKQLQIVEQFADVKKKRDPLVEELNKAGLPVKDEEPEDGEEKFDHDETPPEFRMPECHLLEKLLGRETDTMHEEQTDFSKRSSRFRTVRVSKNRFIKINTIRALLFWRKSD